MTNTQLKTQIDTQITNETVKSGITPTEVGNNIKAVVDYADQQDALKENTLNKSTNTALGTSNILFPTQNAVKTYVDNLTAETYTNKSTNIITDATSDSKYPSVKAVKTYVDNKSIGLPYDSYAVSLSQTGTNAPTETYIFENTIGAIVWTYNGVGIYIGTLASAFPIAKTFLLINQNKAGKKITLEQISASQVKIFTLTDAGVNENNVLNLTSIEIRVYN